MPLLTFEESLDRVESDQRHLLLGNGFSRAWQDDIFAYDALFDRAEFADLSERARSAFDVLETRDFELVMRALREAADLVRLYEPESDDIRQAMANDVAGLRDVLVQAIAGTHPERPTAVAAEPYESCKRFLANFDKIYTLNYDLLLYWTLMQEEIDPQVRCDDGFRTPESGEEEYVTWDPGTVGTQNIFYLHGALHLFDAGSELQKYTWVNTGVPLIDQVRAALEDYRYPHFVAEGESDSKLARIRHSAYLSRGERSFLKIGGALFSYGVSFGSSDVHISHWLAKNRVRQLFVGLHGKWDSPSNQELVKRVTTVADRRENNPLEIEFFDTESATVWG